MNVHLHLIGIIVQVKGPAIVLVDSSAEKCLWTCDSVYMGTQGAIARCQQRQGNSSSQRSRSNVTYSKH